MLQITLLKWWWSIYADKELNNSNMKPIVKFVLVFSFVYCAIIFAVAPFLLAWGWGRKLNFFEKTIFFTFRWPFTLKDSLFNIIPNAVVWGLLTFIAFYILTRLIKVIKKILP